MGIDRHVLLTTDGSFDRQWSVFGAVTVMDTPVESANFIKGVDRLDYHNDMVLVANFGASDGFPFLHQFAKGIHTKYLQQSAGGVALLWNYARILRHIVNSGETILLTWDDRVITVPFEILDAVTEELQNRDDPFYLWQLRIRGAWQDIYAGEGKPLPWYTQSQTQKMDAFEHEDTQSTRSVFDNNIRYADGKYYDTFLRKGLLGFDESMVISPLGAQWLLDQLHAMKDIDPKLDVVFPKNPLDTPQPPERSRMNIDNWICWGIRDAIDKAVASNIGIYCPKKLGYAFIKGEDEWISMGTLTDWAPKGGGSSYEQSIHKTTMNFIDTRTVK